ncbi:MAG: HNH endonuclease [Solobacterium sp.]|nr:HNH endonuclease [Solobacterium sp.]
MEEWQKAGRRIYTDEQRKTGAWVRSISSESKRGKRAFYHTKEWTRKRRQILERDHFMCQKCRQKKPAVYTRANTVHHIKHLNDEPELALTDSNLISLCSACHDGEHPERHYNGAGREYRNVERW